jgi:hypothetical protein
MAPSFSQSQRRPHLGPLVGRRRLALAQQAAFGGAAEIDAEHEGTAQQADGHVDDARAHAALVDKDGVDAMGQCLLGELAGERHEVEAAEPERRDGAGVAAAAEMEGAAVVAEARDVDAHDQRLAGMALGRPARRRLDDLAVDELQAADARKLAVKTTR